MNGGARVRPFPFAELPRVSRQEILVHQRIRAASRTLRIEALAEVLSELTEEVVSIESRRVLPSDPTTIPSTAVAVAFAPLGAPGMERAVVVDVDLPLANELLMKALRQRAPRVTDPSRAPAPEIAGGFAALLHAALRRHSTSALRVVAAGPAPALVRDLAALHHRIATFGLNVFVGDDLFDARVTFPIGELPISDAPAAVHLAALGDAPIALPIVLATCMAGRSDLAGLRPGDAFVLPRSATAELRTNGARLTGPIMLAAPRSERGWTGVLAEGGVLRTGTVASLSWDRPVVPAGGEPEKADPSMSTEGSSSPTLEVLEDAPVVVRVELGVVEMKARDWAALAPGDVVQLGRKLGDPASLRVGGVEIARGELVQIDGEVGVRIVASAMTARSGGT